MASAASAASGLSGYEYATWYGFLAPARTPAPVMELLAKNIREAADDPEVRERYQTLGLSSRIRTLRDFANQTLPRGPAEIFVPERYKLEQIANSEDRKEGATAFREKRAAKFKGR